MAERFIKAHKFGAKGDGKTDDTAALRKALDAAGDKKGAVLFAPGTYLCSTLKVPRNVALVGVPAWAYRNSGTAVLQLADEKAKCLLDITGAVGVTIDGLCLEGGGLGKDVHAVLLDKDDYGKEEDAFRIDRCRISRFTGDGVNATRAWCFSVRHSMISHNGGNGVRLRGWDVFLHDNWLSGNHGAGFGAYDENSSVTMVGNRIEWNRAGGVLIHGGSHYNVTGNYIDRCGGSAIALLKRGDRPSEQFSMSGNLIYRSGKWSDLDTDECCHIRLDGCAGVTLVGNTMVVGRDDAGKGEWRPSYGIVFGGLSNCVIKDNTLHRGALKELLRDLGAHGDGAIVKDNPGCLFVED